MLVKTKQKKAILILISVIFCISLLCACNSKDDTLVIGNGEMNGVFNPFFVETAADETVVKLTSITLNRLTVEGLPESYGAEAVKTDEIKAADGSVEYTKYTYIIKDGIAFSDGSPVTAEDVIFSIKVLCDPSYNGLSAVRALPIKGINEYVYDTENYEEVIEELNAQAEKISNKEIKEYIKQEAVKACEQYSEEEILAYIGDTEIPEDLSGKQKKAAIIEAYYRFEVTNSFDFYVEAAIEDRFNSLRAEYIEDNVGKNNISEISGVKKLDDRTVEITLDGVNPAADLTLGEIVIAPAHYYGISEDGDTFFKGNLQPIREKDRKPLGAGPYVFENYDNNMVALKANDEYFLGSPNIKNLKLIYTTKANTIESIAMGELDVADIEATQKEVAQITEKKLYSVPVEFLGYGYIGINSNNVTDINVRKGLMHLINKEPAVNTYFGGMAKVIERPVPQNSWVYPDGAEAYYQYDKEKALEYFEKAGYAKTLKNGKTILAKDGNQLTIVAGLGGEGTMDHPAGMIFTQMKLDLEEMGANFEINDCDMTVLTDGLYSGSFDIWAAVWDTSADPSDMNSIYMSDAGGNFYGISDKRVDELLQLACSTIDMDKRKLYYKEVMENILDLAVEMPVYQRKHLYVFNTNVVDKTSIPRNISQYRSYIEEIENLKLVEK